MNISLLSYILFYILSSITVSGKNVPRLNNFDCEEIRGTLFMTLIFLEIRKALSHDRMKKLSQMTINLDVLASQNSIRSISVRGVRGVVTLIDAVKKFCVFHRGSTLAVLVWSLIWWPFLSFAFKKGRSDSLLKL